MACIMVSPHIAPSHMAQDLCRRPGHRQAEYLKASSLHGIRPSEVHKWVGGWVCMCMCQDSKPLIGAGYLALSSPPPKKAKILKQRKTMGLAQAHAGKQWSLDSNPKG